MAVAQAVGAGLRRAHRRLDVVLTSLRSRPSSIIAAARRTIWPGTHTPSTRMPVVDIFVRTQGLYGSAVCRHRGYERRQTTRQDVLQMQERRPRASYPCIFFRRLIVCVCRLRGTVRRVTSRLWRRRIWHRLRSRTGTILGNTVVPVDRT